MRAHSGACFSTYPSHQRAPRTCKHILVVPAFLPIRLTSVHRSHASTFQCLLFYLTVSLACPKHMRAHSSACYSAHPSHQRAPRTCEHILVPSFLPNRLTSVHQAHASTFWCLLFYLPVSLACTNHMRAHSSACFSTYPSHKRPPSTCEHILVPAFLPTRLTSVHRAHASTFQCLLFYLTVSLACTAHMRAHSSACFSAHPSHQRAPSTCEHSLVPAFLPTRRTSVHRAHASTFQCLLFYLPVALACTKHMRAHSNSACFSTYPSHQRAPSTCKHILVPAFLPTHNTITCTIWISKQQNGAGAIMPKNYIITRTRVCWSRCLLVPNCVQTKKGYC